MLRALNEIVGLPHTTSVADLAVAVDRYCQQLFAKSSGGDMLAQRELIELQYAYLIWAYAEPNERHTTWQRHASSASAEAAV